MVKTPLGELADELPNTETWCEGADDLRGAYLQGIIDAGRNAATEGKTAMACPHLADSQPEKFEAWMDGFHAESDAT